MAYVKKAKTFDPSKVPFGDVTKTGHAISAAMRDPECEPDILALLIRDAAEASIPLAPGGTWNPTQGFKHWFGFKTELSNGPWSFSKGVFAAYNALAARISTGFTDVDGKTTYAPNPNFGENGTLYDAEAVYKALSEDGTDLVINPRSFKMSRPKANQIGASKTAGASLMSAL